MPSLSLSVRDRVKEIDVGPVYVPQPHVHHEGSLHKDCEKLPPFLPISSPDHSRLVPVHLVDGKKNFIGPSEAENSVAKFDFFLKTGFFC